MGQAHPGRDSFSRDLLHVLPKGFVRIRHYGLPAPRRVNRDLAEARRLLAPRIATPAIPAAEGCDVAPEPWWCRFQRLTGIDVMACPCCGGRLVRRDTARSPPVTG